MFDLFLCTTGWYCELYANDIGQLQYLQDNALAFCFFRVNIGNIQKEIHTDFQTIFSEVVK